MADSLKTRMSQCAAFDTPSFLRANVSEWAKEAGKLEEEITTLRARLQRAMDLVRHQRSELFNEDLITQEEFSALVVEHGAVARLETYDELRARLVEAHHALRLAYRLPRPWMDLPPEQQVSWEEWNEAFDGRKGTNL